MSPQAHRRALLLVGLGALLPGLVEAYAPPDQYKNYLSTDDVLTDKQTGLDWDRRAFTESIVVAEMHCAPSPGANPRFPSVKELATLLDNEPTYISLIDGGLQPIYIDPNAFPGTPPEPFWTSTKGPNGGVFVVDFGTGEIRVVPASALANFRAHVRCVK